MIDPILATDDKNGDGYIDYKEFVLAQQAAATQKDVWNPFPRSLKKSSKNQTSPTIQNYSKILKQNTHPGKTWNVLLLFVVLPSHTTIAFFQIFIRFFYFSMIIYVFGGLLSEPLLDFLNV